MKRSFLTLGASVLALAMTGGPAWAASAAPQVDDSIVAVQAGRWRSTPPCGLSERRAGRLHGRPYPGRAAAGERLDRGRGRPGP